MNKQEKTKRIDLPIPSDALKPCALLNYKGWSFMNKGKNAVMILDIETTGLDNEWNSILQMSWQVIDTTSWKELSKQNFYFKHPTNKKRVEKKAIEINGLTESRLEELGTTPLKKALWTFKKDFENCILIVGHNIEFDIHFIFHTFHTMYERTEDEIYKFCMPTYNQLYCTMKNTVDLCCLCKYPRLYELANQLNISYQDLQLHDSADDVELTKRCFQKLVEIKFLNL